MLEGISAFFVENITWVVQTQGYLAIFVLMALESMLIPIPSEITMPFAGFLVSQGKLNFWLVSFTGALANLIGSLAAYWLGRWGQRGIILSLVKKYGKFLLISVHEVERAEKWFRNHGELIAFSARLLPVIRTFISLPAGMSGMNVYKFSLYTFVGAFIWSTVLTQIGVVLGNNWHSIEGIFRKFQFFIMAVLILLVVWYIWHKVKGIRQI